MLPTSLTGVPLHSAVHGASPQGSDTRPTSSRNRSDWFTNHKCDAVGDLPRLSFPSHSAFFRPLNGKYQVGENVQPDFTIDVLVGGHQQGNRCSGNHWQPLTRNRAPLNLTFGLQDAVRVNTHTKDDLCQEGPRDYSVPAALFFFLPSGGARYFSGVLSADAVTSVMVITKSEVPF